MKRIKLIAAIGLLVPALLTQNGCKNCDKVDPDLLFGVISIAAETFVPGSGQVVDIVSPYLNDFLDKACNNLDTPGCDREVKMYYRTTSSDPWVAVDFATEGTQDTTSSVRVAVEPLANGASGSKNDRFGFSTNGEYKVQQYIDIDDIIAERDESNNTGDGSTARMAEGNGHNGTLFLTIDIGPEGERRMGPNERVVVTYMGSR